MASKLTTRNKKANLDWNVLERVANGDDVPQDYRELATDYVDFFANTCGMEDTDKDELVDGWYVCLKNTFRPNRERLLEYDEVPIKNRIADRLNDNKCNRIQNKATRCKPSRKKRKKPSSPSSSNVADRTEHARDQEQQSALVGQSSVSGTGGNSSSNSPSGRSSDDQGSGFMAEEKERLLRDRLDGEREQRLCVICQENEKCCLLLPCRHLCLCKECSRRPELKTCPLCRKPIRQKLDVFC